MSRSPRQRGYTLIEVMVSLAVLAVGASGVIALQKVTGLGNTTTRNIATANRVAAKWAERLDLDGRMWSEAAGFTNTHWLKKATPPPGAWIIPDEVPLYASPDADVLGADRFPGDPTEPAFCTELRLTVLPGYSKAIRAEIRVFWDKGGDPADCTLSPAVVSASPQRYGIVSTLIGIVATQ